ncbi:UbiA family prenyltransferase [Pyruvatibacter sp.]|uniref:UbiA family prenyltransferase n=1 Tax=Pyruvatibacter sp. TaxID=1981328 RepID=UPI0032ED833B
MPAIPDTQHPPLVVPMPVTPGKPAQMPLVLDLDGALIRTDILFETFVAYVRENPLRLFQVAAWALRGRAVLKQKLARAATLDVDGLPVTEDLVSYAAREAAHGRMVCLATATDRLIADRIAERFPFISKVFASDGETNLKSSAKAAVLTKAFPDGFEYAGDSRADVPVWRAASRSIVVNPTAGVLRAARTIREPEQVFARPKTGFRFVAKVLRLHQWAKNGLIFAPLMLGGLLFDASAWVLAGAGFLALSLLASATYLLNDLFDLADDRRHWSKSKRPLASGRLKIAHALLLIPAGMMSAYAIAAWIGPIAIVFLTAYLALTLAYSFRLKRIELLDAAVLATLFTLRLGFGVALASVALSPWLLVFSMFLFLSLSFAKRHVEVTRMEARGRKEAAGRGYKAGDGPMVAMIGAASGLAAVQVMVMYVMNEAYTAGTYTQPLMLWAVPPILFLWIARVWLLAQRGELDDDPVAFAVKDGPSLLLGAVLGMVFLAALFGSPV